MQIGGGDKPGKNTKQILLFVLYLTNNLRAVLSDYSNVKVLECGLKDFLFFFCIFSHLLVASSMVLRVVSC